MTLENVDYKEACRFVFNLYLWPFCQRSISKCLNSSCAACHVNFSNMFELFTLVALVCRYQLLFRSADMTFDSKVTKTVTPTF